MTHPRLLWAAFMIVGAGLFCGGRRHGLKQSMSKRKPRSFAPGKHPWMPWSGT